MEGMSLEEHLDEINSILMMLCDKIQISVLFGIKLLAHIL